MNSIKALNDTLKTFWPDWTIEYEIGTGSHGTVYRAVNQKTHEAAAIKMIPVPQNSSEVISLMSEGNDEATARSYFLEIVNDYINEIRVMDQLKGSPNIVDIQDYQVVEHSGEIGWDIFIRMELLTSFLDFYNDEKPDQADIIRLGIDICRALCACSKHQIIHRDIKPENIFVSAKGDFKLGDFGIARQLDRQTSNLTRTGTYNYMAPEVYKGHSYSENVDIYSLGIVLYRYTNNNHLPFLNTEKQLIPYNERAEAFEQRISGKELPSPRDASPAFAALILRACRYQPSERYANAQEMLDDLNTLRQIDKNSRRAINKFISNTRKTPLYLQRRRAITASIIFAAAVITAAIVIPLQTGAHTVRDTSPAVTYIPPEDLGEGANYVSWEDSGLTDHVMKWNDRELETNIRAIIGKSRGDIMLSEVWDLQDLELDYCDIEDISALAELTNLYSLSLNGNEVSDLTPVGSLINLEYLYLDNNRIIDLAPLASLSKLNILTLKNNQIGSIAPLAGLTQLEYLSLSYNENISDMSALKSLTNLRTLYLQQTGISDPSVIGTLTSLTDLDLNGNSINDLSSLAGLTHLVNAEFSANSISDISVVKNWPDLELLYLNDNHIRDITPLKACTKLRFIRLKNNPISDYSILEDRAFEEKDF